MAKISLTPTNLKELMDAFDHFFPEGFVYSRDKPFFSGDFSWENKEDFKDFVLRLTGVKIKDDQDVESIKNAQLALVKLVSGEDEAKKVELSQTTISQEQVKAIEQGEEKKRKDQEARKISDEEVRSALQRRKDIQEQRELYQKEIAKTKALQEKLKATRAKVYTKVEIPQAVPDSTIEASKVQAKDHPEKFFNITVEEIKKNPALAGLSATEVEIEAKQAAFTVYDTFTGNSPLTQAAVLQKIAESPLTPVDLKTPLQILIEQKLSQYELAKKLYPSLDKIDGVSKIEDVQVSVSATPKEGFKEFDFEKEVASPHLEYLENQNNFLDSIKDLGVDEFKPQILLHVGKILDSQITKLPVESLVSRAWNADIVKLGLARIGLIEAPSIVAVEGSFLGKAIVATGFGDVANFVQIKTGVNLGVNAVTKVASALAGKAIGTGAAAVGAEAMGASIGAAVSSLIPIPVLVQVAGAAVGAWIGSKIPLDKIGKFLKKALPVVGSLVVGALLWRTVGPLTAMAGGAVTWMVTTGTAPVAFAVGVLTFISHQTIFLATRALIQMGIGFAVLIVSTALILFVINSGAYVVPSLGNFTCDIETGEQFEESSAAVAAVCIVSYLNQFQLNPLLHFLIGTTAWNSLEEALPPPATEALSASAISTNWLQCVGFVSATAGLAYGQNFDQINACSYIENPPSGYSYISGTDGIESGDFFLIDGLGGCKVGSPGHIGVVISVDGVLISCADANFTADGEARTAHGCFALSQLAGYLRR